MYNLIKTSVDSLSKLNLGVQVFDQKVFNDDRGKLNLKFEGIFPNIISNAISIKESISNPYSARGLHFQYGENGQSKIISVGYGKIIDVFFDTRDDKKNVYYFFLEGNMRVSIYLPSSFAHGFISLTETKFEYCCIGKYYEKNEITFNLLPSIARYLNLSQIKLSLKDKSFQELSVNQNSET